MKNKKTRDIRAIKDINIYICLSLLVLVPLILNWKIINYDYTKLDDSTIITNNYGFLSDFKNVLKTFEKDNFLSKEGKGYYRPVQTISFMIDAQLSGDKPQTYHFFNLFYHILTVISLFFLLKLFGIKNNLSLLMSLLFAVHPLFTDAISWIVGRGDILAGLFGTLSIILFIKYNDTNNKIYYFLHCVTFAVAIFSKEISLSIPVIIVFYYWFVKNNKYKLRRLLPFLGFWVLSIVSFIYLRNKFLNPQDILSFESFVRNLPVIPILFAKWFLPFGLSPMPVFTVFYTAAGIILITLSSYYIIKFKSVNKNIILMGALWFLVLIIPGMFVRIYIAKYQFEYLECRAYFPSIGIFLAAGFLLNELLRRNETIKPVNYFIPLILIFSILTFSYSNVFANPLDFYSSVINSNPENAYALCSRGLLYSSNGNMDSALGDFNNSINALSIYSEPYYDIGALYNSAGNHLLSEKFYEEALKYDTLYHTINNLREYAFINLSSVKLSLKKYDETIELLKKCDIQYPGNCSVHNNLGLAYYAKADYPSAFTQYTEAIAENNAIYSYYNNRGMTEYQLKNFKGAVDDFNTALNLNNGFQDAWTNRGIARIELNDYEGAISDLTTSISNNPKNGIAWYFRGVAYSKLNNSTLAKENWQNADRLGFRLPSNKTGN